MRLKLQTDACDRGISGILFQIDDSGNHGLLAATSRCLSDDKMQWSTTEKELIAIVYAITKFRAFLIGVNFELVTDHKGLTFLSSTMFQSAGLKRWSLLRQQYNFSVTHCKGTDNVAADFLSRNLEGRFLEESNENLIISAINKLCDVHIEVHENSCLVALMRVIKNYPVFGDFKKIADLQKNDIKIAPLLEKMNNDGTNNFLQIYENVLFQRNRKNNNWRIVIPTNLQKRLINAIHQKLGHVGVFKTNEYLKKFFTWRGMNRDVKKHVKSCDTCQRTKYLSISMENEYQMVRAEAPNDLVTVDFYGPLPRGRGGVEYIFVMIDAFSKHVTLYFIRRATTRACIKRFLIRIFLNVGNPSEYYPIMERNSQPIDGKSNLTKTILKRSLAVFDTRSQIPQNA